MPPFATHSCVACSLHGPRCFCQLPADALRELDLIGTTLQVDARQVFKREGYTADRIFIICSGRVKLTASSAEGRLLLLRIAGAGDVIGLASVVGGTTYRITAEAVTDCELKAVPRDSFLKFLRSFPDASINTAEAIARAHDSALLSARRLALSTSAAGKLANTLLDWAHMDHSNTASALEFNMPLTHEELGCMSGLSRETVTRLLGRFRSEGLIEQIGERMSIQQPARLEAMYC